RRAVVASVRPIDRRRSHDRGSGRHGLGQQFVVENRPGAGGNIGTEVVVRAPADGYTLLMVGTPAAINATLYDKLNFNFIRDIAPVAGVIRCELRCRSGASSPTMSRLVSLGGELSIFS